VRFKRRSSLNKNKIKIFFSSIVNITPYHFLKCSDQFRISLYGTLIGNLTREVELSGQCGAMTNGSGRDGLDLESLRLHYLENEDR